jgi:uncharacterized protein (UPF0128 family)
LPLVEHHDNKDEFYKRGKNLLENMKINYKLLNFEEKVLVKSFLKTKNLDECLNKLKKFSLYLKLYKFLELKLGKLSLSIIKKLSK